jgi:hypothetical protein
MSGCATDQPIPVAEMSDSEYLVFGRFYGMCDGADCIGIYRIDKEKLYEDTLDNYPSNNNIYDGKFVELTRNKFLDTKNIINYFPQKLLTEKSTVIGTPDAGDWGGLYIEYNFGNIHKFWLVDQMKSNVPEEYHDFIDMVNEKIDNLQQRN